MKIVYRPLSVVAVLLIIRRHSPIILAFILVIVTVLLDISYQHGCLQTGSMEQVPLENIQARFTSVMSFWFTQKEPKSLPTATFHQLRIYLNCICSWALSLTPLGELTALAPNPPPGFNGAALQQGEEGRVDGRKGQERKIGEERGGKKESDGLDLPPLQKFLWAPMLIEDMFGR